MDIVMVAQASLGGCNTGAKATSEGPGLHMLGLAVVNHVTLLLGIIFALTTLPDLTDICQNLHQHPTSLGIALQIHTYQVKTMCI